MSEYDYTNKWDRIGYLIGALAIVLIYFWARGWL
jgi:hypothetical protein